MRTSPIRGNPSALIDAKGNVLVLAALAMPVLVGAAGLATDTVQWALTKRVLQQQADAGAMSGAYARAQGADVPSAVKGDLNATAKVRLFGPPIIENGPTVGAYAGQSQAVRVVLSSRQALPFSGLFLSTAPILTVEATSLVASSGQYCVIALDPDNVTGIRISGNATLDLGCGINANAKGSSAISAAGSSYANVTAAAAVGLVPASGAFPDSTKIFSHALPQSDPFAKLPDPYIAHCNNYLRVNPNLERDVTPGCYSGFDIKGTVNFAPGIYYIDGSSGGTFNIGSQATLTGSDVTFILTSSSAITNPATIATADVDGGATINLSASTSGAYAGVLFYQDRRALDNTTNLINGNADSSIQGAVYFPGQAISYTGNAGMKTDCFQLVARRATFSGNSSISNTCDQASGAHAFLGTIVRLVG
ncbi:pilus assembly protein TadG-related protein [Sphingomonas oligophenolica]|uniref:Putative Flp pilus-assembly TadG-like N-terminal domain-containing protein n=1 Tax=Sphingomonas oligophenolica TaxID=301154 RepID=A0A502CJ17_9SPHN|nr:pilus assembly protein TadG-related protein [Sphingomonas oligophenolica]TPG13187.1 hypothetical protein EAH84_07245 [Sphingomonas oligophenolica]